MALKPVIGGSGFYEKSASSSGGGATNLSMTRDATTVTINSNTGTDATIPVATSLLAGALVASDKSKLDSIEASADVTDAVNVGTSISGATAKTTPVNADSFGIIDSEASSVLKKLTFTNLKTFLKTYFDTLYNLYTLPAPTTTVMGGVKRNTGTAGQFVNGINSTGDLVYGTPSGGGSSISTPRVYYVESDGNDGTGAVGNPALPYATGTAAWSAGIAAGQAFAIKFGIGNFTINCGDIGTDHLASIIGCGMFTSVNLTKVTINAKGSDAIDGSAQSGGYVSLSISNVYLVVDAGGGNVETSGMDNGGNGGDVIITGCGQVSIQTNGGGDSGASSGSVNGGSGGDIVLSGAITVMSSDQLFCIGNIGLNGGSSGADGSISADGCDLRTSSIGVGVGAVTLGRTSYITGLSITNDKGGNAAY